MIKIDDGIPVPVVRKRGPLTKLHQLLRLLRLLRLHQLLRLLTCCASLFEKNLKGDPAGALPSGAPPIPIIPGIDKVVFDAINLGELKLKMDHWHTCNTTHCRAGLVVHLAGEAGYALERFHNTALAAQLIYRESGAPISPVQFYVSDAEALADMKKRAEG